MAQLSLAGLGKEILNIKKGTMLMKQGEIGRSAYFVVEGRLLVERETDGEHVVLAEIGPHNLVGEFAILDNEPRSATVTAVEDSVLIEIDKHRIRTIVRRSPDIAELVFRILCHKLRQDHQLISRTNDISNPENWLKILRVLQLCSKADTDPGTIYSSFFENVQMLAQIPIHRVRIILERLEKARMIKLDGKKIIEVDHERIDAFYLNCFEDNANEDFNFASTIKQYYALNILRNSYKPTQDDQDWIEIPYKDVMQVLLDADLWKNLRPDLQRQRAQVLLNNLLATKTLSLSPIVSGNVRITFNKLSSIQKPEQLISKYEITKNTLFKPIQDTP